MAEAAGSDKEVDEQVSAIMEELVVEEEEENMTVEDRVKYCLVNGGQCPVICFFQRG
jgi:hypothetical protein